MINVNAGIKFSLEGLTWDRVKETDNRLQ